MALYFYFKILALNHDIISNNANLIYRITDDGYHKDSQGSLRCIFTIMLRIVSIVEEDKEQSNDNETVYGN